MKNLILTFFLAVFLSITASVAQQPVTFPTTPLQYHHVGDYVYRIGQDPKRGPVIKVEGRYNQKQFWGILVNSINEGSICDTVSGYDQDYVRCSENQCPDLCK